MKICILGEYSGHLDEGMRNVAFHLEKELSKNHKVFAIEIRNIWNYRKIVDINPEIVHYIHGPTIKSLIILKSISNLIKTKTVISAMHPRFNYLSEKFIPLFKPSLILTQSIESENLFNRCGCNTKFFPCGVDTNIFIPISKDIKDKLKEVYGIDKKKFVILHIGSIKKGRNVQLLEKLQKDDNQVIIIGALSVGIDYELVNRLKKIGCLVWLKYFENIYDIYAMADCYVFPVLNKKDILGREKANSIEMPLSVLEAMSCNLPIITTKFGALSRAFKETNGLFFAERQEDFFKILNTIKQTEMEINTRDLIQDYSWEKVIKKLEIIYEQILNGDII